VGGLAPGYRSVPDGQKTRLECVPEEAALVPRIFKLYASALGLWGVANKVNREGYRTKLGNLFGPPGIAKILDNPMYIGKIRFEVLKD